MRAQIIAFAVFVYALAYPLSPTAELIEPTRTLQGTSNAPGNLTILSEPPELVATLDDNHIGKTPIFLKNVKSGIHRLRIQKSETEIYVAPGGTLQISLFKGEFIKLPVAEKEPVKRQVLKEKKVNETQTIQQTPHEEQKNPLTPWERFVNGSLNHF